MAELPARGLEVAVEVGRIASAPGRVDERAEAMLEPLRRLVPFQAVRIFLTDPASREQTDLVCRGYDEPIQRYLTSTLVRDEIELLELDRRRAAMRLADLPVPPERVYGWTEYLKPAGFREGLAVALFTSDDRYLGVLGLNTDTDRHPSEAARDLIGMLAPAIANAVDPLRSIVTTAAIVHTAEAGIVLTAAGAVVSLPGLPTHPLLQAGSLVLGEVAARLATGRVFGTFLCPYPSRERPRLHRRITMLSSPRERPRHLTAVVFVSPPGDIRGLTPRELELLGMMVDGWPNHRIAASMFITQRTVAAHVEHILVKLSAATRTLAAVRALRHGLYVPRPLNHVWPEDDTRAHNK
jgi:DNA-binding CsgD family transcriptional regulator